MDEFFAQVKEKAEQAETAAEETPDGAADAEAPKQDVDPMDIAESMWPPDNADNHPEA